MKKWHEIFPNSGKGKQMVQIVDWIQQHRLQNQSIMDFGCGKGGTMDWIRGLYSDCTVTGYDPGTTRYATLPTGLFAGIYSIDCFEHIDRAELIDTIQLLRGCTHPRGIWCHIIDLTPAIKQLPDGRNAHITLMTTQEWQQVFESDGCRIHQMQEFTQPDPNFGVRRRLQIEMYPHPVSQSGRPHKNL